MRTSIYGTKVAFISIYAPAVFEDSFYPDLTEELLKLTEYELVLGGDMNVACNLDLDLQAHLHIVSNQPLRP